MKRVLAAILLALPLAVHASSWFQFEAGVGKQWSRDMGDGIWYQKGGPYTRTVAGNAWLIGATGTIIDNGTWSLRYHLDYVYYGGLEASCSCVGDDEYDPANHVRLPSGRAAHPAQFNGFGHVQGVPLTLDVGYTTHGVRFALEGGMWAYRPTWHETVLNDNGTVSNLSHHTSTQFGYVVGARVESGNSSLSYRYYQVRDLWAPTPGIVTGTHMLMFVHRF